MIPYESCLLDNIQDAVLDFIEEIGKDEVNNFSINLKIRVDEGTVFYPKIIEEGGGEE